MQDYILCGKVDVNESIPPFSVKQYDNNSRAIHIELVDKDNPDEKAVNLTNHTIKACFCLADGSLVLIDGNLIDAPSGKFSVMIPGKATRVADDVKCEIVITGEDGSLLSLPVFSFLVLPSLMNEPENEGG